jgi:hypothetical protein
MGDPKETIYEADPHTKAKHAILREYLKRWLPILSRQAKRVGSRQCKGSVGIGHLPWFG